MTRTAVALLSGGLDSSVLVHQLLFEDFEVHALTVDYGQRHARELEAAEAVAHDAKIPFYILPMGTALATVFRHAQSSQVGARLAVPHGHYAAENMKTTIVPNRNMLLLALAGTLAESLLTNEGPSTRSVIAYAAHAGDHTIYPDCRPEFYESCAETIFRATDGRVSLYAPFGRITKTDIVKRGKALRVPFGLTWSCYDPQVIRSAGEWTKNRRDAGYRHCGACGTCVERKEAFRDAGVEDPTEYAS